MYGSFVRSARHARGMSQAELAAVSGVAQSNISAIEHDRRLPSADTLNRLLVACGFQLAAVSHDRTLRCALPRAGWFPDEDLPPPVPGDPPDSSPVVRPGASMEERGRVLAALLDTSDAVRAP
ncbi:MAG TPA: helix-turn-helix transcriptional regulator [Acidimicrobiales bacterium]|nr:helix-turn-helix transcriptional regulator [Acidimicrobiales bacterium]